MSDSARIAQLLFPHVTQTPAQLMEQVYPPRELKEGAAVTRFAPSPTGFLHIGGVFTSLVAERVAHLSGGKVILRIEDTDKKREVEGGAELIVRGLSDFGIYFDEGVLPGGEQGAYGPYRQSMRAELYHVFCKDLVERGLAYPCFCTEDELAEYRARQEQSGVTPGYWGEYAEKCRSRSYDEIKALVDAGTPYVVRLRSPGKPGGRVKLRDVIRGEIEMEENFIDVVLLKSDGIPTYHFAHVVDDTLMRVTQVIRGEEWVASAPIHLQLFWLCGLKAPKYAHVSPIMKEDGGAKRKLSKRKDPEAAVSYFSEQGYPASAVTEYLLTIANSDFEDWRRQNREAPCSEFPFSLKKMSLSGALFDLVKLQSVSAEVISRMTAEEVCESVLAWAKEYDADLYARLSSDKSFAAGIFAIDRGGKKPRKDIAKWSDVRGYLSYFFDDMLTRENADTLPDGETRRAILQAYLEALDAADDKDTWFEKIRGLCAPLGFCPDVKQYKESPEQYRGHVGDVSAVIRMALTGRLNTPDLHAITALLGQERCLARIKDYMEKEC